MRQETKTSALQRHASASRDHRRGAFGRGGLGALGDPECGLSN